MGLTHGGGGTHSLNSWENPSMETFGNSLPIHSVIISGCSWSCYVRTKIRSSIHVLGTNPRPPCVITKKPMRLWFDRPTENSQTNLVSHHLQCIATKILTRRIRGGPDPRQSDSRLCVWDSTESVSQCTHHFVDTK